MPVAPARANHFKASQLQAIRLPSLVPALPMRPYGCQIQLFFSSLAQEARIPPIDLHLDKMLLLHEGKQLDTPIKAIAKKARERIGGRLHHLRTKLLETNS
jgi:hypothetical protein